MDNQRVDFYLLSSTKREDVLINACRIANKAYQQGMRIYLQLDQENEIQHLDRLLWTFSSTSFVPHAVGANDSGVEIGDNADAAGHNQMLISLTEKLPAAAIKFERIADLVSADEHAKLLGRQRFKAYREYGIEPGTHQI